MLNSATFLEDEVDAALLELERLATAKQLHTLFEQGTPFVQSVADHLKCSHHLAGMAMALASTLPSVSSELNYVYTKLYP